MNVFYSVAISILFDTGMSGGLVWDIH